MEHIINNKKCNYNDDNLLTIDISNLKVPEEPTNTKQDEPCITICDLNILEKDFGDSKQYNEDSCAPQNKEITNPSLDISCLDVVKKSKYLLKNNFLSEFRTNAEKALVMQNILLLDRIPTEGSTRLINSGDLYKLMKGNQEITDYLISIVNELKNYVDNPLWITDNQYTVKIRQDLDNNSATDKNRLGDFAITQDSEVFFAKEKYSRNSGNILISLQSLINQLQTILGIEPTYETIDNNSGDSSIYQKITGSNINNVLTTNSKESLVAAINELNSKLGELTNLNTENKTNIVDTINELLILIQESQIESIEESKIVEIVDTYFG